MFDDFDGEINGQGIYDSDFVDQLDSYGLDEEFAHRDEEDSIKAGYKIPKQEPAPKILEGEIKRETDKAILFKFGESENWMPKSQVKIKKKKEGCSVEIPDWLWKRMTEEIEEND